MPKALPMGITWPLCAAGIGCAGAWLAVLKAAASWTAAWVAGSSRPSTPIVRSIHTAVMPTLMAKVCRAPQKPPLGARVFSVS